MGTSLKRYRRALGAIEAVDAADTPSEIFDGLRVYTEELGGTSLIIGRVVNPIFAGQPITQFGMSDWPGEWAERWVTQDLILKDPITRYAIRARGMFEWDEAKRVGTRVGNAMLDQGRDYGFDKGLAIPISVGIMPMGLISVGYNEPPHDDDARHLEMVATHAYVRTLDLIEGVGGDALPSVPLTSREIDVLSFTALGKSAWEISMIYSISESTVKKHLANIASKLGTANKSHSVAVALRSGQIIP